MTDCYYTFQPPPLTYYRGDIFCIHTPSLAVPMPTYYDEKGTLADPGWYWKVFVVLKAICWCHYDQSLVATLC